MVDLSEISIKMKNCKTFYEGQTASRRVKEIIQSLKTDKILLRLWNKNVLMEMCINIQTFPFKVLQE